MRDRLAALRRAGGVEPLAVAGLGVMAAGVAIVADRLVEAAQASSTAGSMGWAARLELGLWTFRLEHAASVTAGAALLTWALVRGATLGGWRAHAARVAGGLMVGLAIVAAAMVLAATAAALSGSIGAGLARVQLSERERVFTWLLQVTTAIGGAAIWAVLAVRLAEVSDAAPAPEREPPDAVPAGEPERPAWGPAIERPAPAPAEPDPGRDLERVADPGPPVAVRPAPPPPAAVANPPAPATAAVRAQALYREQLAWSPRRTAARELVDEVARLERAGDGDAAAAAVRRLERLAGSDPPVD